MSPKEAEGQNVWFGVSMFLLGLIAGGVLSMTTGGSFVSDGGTKTPSAPSAPQAPAKADVTTRMTGYAVDLGIAEGDFTACLNDKKDEFTALINKQMSEGQNAGIGGTPGNIIYDMKTAKGRIVSGARPFDSFKKNIDEMLKDPNTPISDATVEEAKNVVPVDPATDHVFGNPNAKLAIIEYSDYECPFCHAVHPTYKRIMEEYGDDVMWVYRHFPLSFHPEAMPFAIGSECVASLKGNDAFWQYTDSVMSE